MLKIQNVKMRVKCPKHPKFNPEHGIAAVKGGCVRCSGMVEALTLHKRLMRLLIDDLKATRERPKRKPKPSPQMSMFEAVAS